MAGWLPGRVHHGESGSIGVLQDCQICGSSAIDVHDTCLIGEAISNPGHVAEVDRCGAHNFRGIFLNVSRRRGLALVRTLYSVPPMRAVPAGMITLDDCRAATTSAGESPRAAERRGVDVNHDLAVFPAERRRRRKSGIVNRRTLMKLSP